MTKLNSLRSSLSLLTNLKHILALLNIFCVASFNYLFKLWEVINKKFKLFHSRITLVEWANTNSFVLFSQKYNFCKAPSTNQLINTVESVIFIYLYFDLLWYSSKRCPVVRNIVFVFKQLCQAYSISKDIKLNITKLCTINLTLVCVM